MHIELCVILYILFLKMGDSAESGTCLKNIEVPVARHFYVDQSELPLRIEVTGRTSHQLISYILKILLKEVLGYPLVQLVKEELDTVADNATTSLQKISSCESPTNCSKVNVNGPEIMMNLEVWLTSAFSLEKWRATNRIEDCGPVGPIERSGWFVSEQTSEFFWNSNRTIIDHYKAFKKVEIAELFDLSNDEYVKSNIRERKLLCTSKHCGADHIYRPRQCLKTTRCATLLADYPATTFKMLKHEITSYNLLVSVAWVGEKLEEIIESRTLEKKNTLFFHRSPNLISSIARFVRVTFPSCEDDSICKSEVNRIEKIAWSKIKTNAKEAFYVIQSIQFTQSEYVHLLKQHKHLRKQRGIGVAEVACEWLKDNKKIWRKWIPVNVKNKTTLYIGGIFPVHGTYWKQYGVIPAAHMAKIAINKNNSLLADYTLEILEQDGHCAADKVMKSFINYLTNVTYDRMVGILGPACSDTVKPIAGVAKHYNTIMITYSAEGNLLSNEKNYPYLFRTIPENKKFRFVYLALFEKLAFRTVAALTEEGQKFPEYLTLLQDLMQAKGMPMIVNRKFPRERMSTDMKPYLQDLKDKGAKIIIGEFYEHAASAVMCAAYQLGMTAANGYVWFLPYWFSADWYRKGAVDSKANKGIETIECTERQMKAAINGHMSLSYKYYADNRTIMQENKTVREWLDEYEQFDKANNISRYGGFTYDAVWVYALALDALLKENNSHVATLHSHKTTRRLAQFINATNFVGVTGPLYFSGSSRIADVLIWQWINDSNNLIGIYNSSNKALMLRESKIKWFTPNGNKPEDRSVEFSYCNTGALQKILKVTCELSAVVANLMGFTAFALLLIIVGIVYKHRLSSAMKKKLKTTEELMMELGLVGKRGPICLDEWEMPRNSVVMNRKLGEGAFGMVYGGEAYIEKKGWISVAVKTLKSGAKQHEKLDFLGEAEVMKQFDHINIVKLIGVCTMGEPAYTVMEFMLHGDLKKFLLSRRSLTTEKGRLEHEISDKRLTSMAMDIARGLSYLANLKYVHRDLACRNCLVNAAITVKIADFGMCRAMYDSDYYRYDKRGMLPIRWMAPESIIDGIFSPMTDVWSYGIVLYEIITFASHPYRGLNNNQVLERIKKNQTLSIPKGVKPILNDLMARCWSKSPQNRPRAAEIVEIFANNCELISPCLDVPMASVEIEDASDRGMAIHKRSRMHSLSAWKHRKSCSDIDECELGDLKSLHIVSSGNENMSASKHFEFKYANKNVSFQENFKKSKGPFKDTSMIRLPESTYL